MGRLLKKKDPEKKKAQRVQKTQNENESSVSTSGVSAKPTPFVKKSAPPAKAKTGIQEQNIFQKSIQFLREVKIELKKVTWPTRKQTMGSTVVVLVLWMIISLFLGMVDFSLSSLMRVVLP